MKGIIFTEEGIKCIFEEAEELENIQSGESIAAIFGKIQKWFPHFSEFSSILDGDGNLVLPANIKLNNKMLISPGTGDSSIQIGIKNKASGIGSIAIGSPYLAGSDNGNTAYGNYSLVFGDSNAARGNHSLAIGYDNDTYGEHSLAFGYGNTASGKFSLAFGENVVASVPYQAVFGKFNKADSKQMFIIGNGTSTDARSNALTLDFDGNLRTAGDVTATDSNGNSVSLCDAAQSISKSQNSITELQKSLGMTKGKNLLKNTVGTTTQKGITFKYNSDGSVTCNGTATADTNYRFVITLPQNTSFILSGCPTGGSTSTYQLFAMDTDTWSNIYRDTGNGKTFNTESHTEWTFTIRISNGQTVNNLTFYPMLRNASIADSTYTPYTDDLQTQINELKSQIAALTSSATISENHGDETQ